MTFRLRTLSPAHRDVTRILNWIAIEQNAPKGAARWLRAYQAAAKKMVRSPTSYGLAPENEFVEREVRQFLFKTRKGRIYRGLFTINDDEVIILRVRGPGQPPLEPNELR